MLEEAGQPFTVLVVDDHPLVRAGVKASLEQTGQYRVVGECQTPEQALVQLRELCPQLLILDIMLGQECSLHWLDRFIAVCPRLRILVLSFLQTGESIRRLDHPAVAGFILKSEATDRLLQAVRVILSGETWFSQDVSAELRRLHQANRNCPSPGLTSREQEVLNLLKEGKDNAAIAAIMGLSIHTVRRHVTIIYEKMGVESRVAAILQ